jgi:hypothetical protein
LDAERRLAAYLERAVLTNAQYVPDSLITCDWPTNSVLALAAYRVLGSVERGDTVKAWAEVTTAAEEKESARGPDRPIAVQRVRRDTLHWNMTRDPAGGWGVCGYSIEGWDFRHHGYDDPNREWTPKGSSYRAVRAVVDSIRRHPNE